MTKHSIGDRVGAVSHADETTIYLFGYGTYQGDEVPAGAGGVFGDIMQEQGLTNPKIVLDSGKVVWGCECWWGSEESIRAKAAAYEQVVTVDIDAARSEGSHDEA